MKNTVGVLFITLGALLLLAGAVNLIATLLNFIAGPSNAYSAYSIGFYVGRGLASALFFLLGWKAFTKGRRRMSGTSMAAKA